MQGNKDLIPSILTLALNDAITYDKVSYYLVCFIFKSIADFENEKFTCLLSLQATKTGGPNGSIRFR